MSCSVDSATPHSSESLVIGKEVLLVNVSVGVGNPTVGVFVDIHKFREIFMHLRCSFHVRLFDSLLSLFCARVSNCDKTFLYESFKLMRLPKSISNIQLVRPTEQVTQRSYT